MLFKKGIRKEMSKYIEKSENFVRYISTPEI